jgi:hypothetical protein
MTRGYLVCILSDSEGSYMLYQKTYTHEKPFRFHSRPAV